MLCALVATAACSKSEQEPQPTPPPTPAETYYIASIEETFVQNGTKETSETSHKTLYKYDEQMRLSSIEEFYPMSPYKTAISSRLNYTDNTLTMFTDEHKAQDNLSQATEHRLSLSPSSKQALTLEHTPYFKEGGANKRTEDKYSFTADGKQASYSSSFVNKATLTWSLGDMTSVRYEREYTIVEQRAYTTIKNNIYPDLNHFLVKMYLSPQMKYVWSDNLGLRSAHLMKKVSYSSPQGYQTPSNFEYSYEIDYKGRPTKITEQAQGADHHRIYTITYVAH